MAVAAPNRAEPRRSAGNVQAPHAFVQLRSPGLLSRSSNSRWHAPRWTPSCVRLLQNQPCGGDNQLAESDVAHVPLLRVVCCGNPRCFPSTRGVWTRAVLRRTCCSWGSRSCS